MDDFESPVSAVPVQRRSLDIELTSFVIELSVGKPIEVVTSCLIPGSFLVSRPVVQEGGSLAGKESANASSISGSELIS